MGVYRPSLEGDASQAAIEAEEEEELAPFVTGSFSATPQQVSEACAQSYPTCRASRRMAGSRAMHSLAALPQAALLAIARLLPPLERRTVLPLVCKRFAALAAASDLWEQVQLSLPADFAQTLSVAALYAWFVARAGQVRSLHVDMSGEAAWAPLLAVLGVVGRGLQHLRLAGDGAACALPGCTAPWLALTPNLHSLELDEVCDAAVADALWPPGLTRLELGYCGEEGLYSIPTHLERCTALQTLAVQCAMFDNELTVDRLAACTTLERLDLSNCCLSRVPRVLASLPRLTSLTLNENDALGASAAALETLSTLTSLQVLEMRECGLQAVPSSVAGLTQLRSLLLGYNAMTERPCIPPGPYLAGLRVLAMSDAAGFQDEQPLEQALLEPLRVAGSLQVLRINRCMGLQLSLEDVGTLLQGKPHFRKLEFSEDMLSDPRDLAELRQRYPLVTFKAVD